MSAHASGDETPTSPDLSGGDPDVVAPEDRGGRRGWPRARRVIGSDWFLGLLLTLLCWPYSKGDLAPYAGFDPSWNAALAMAARQGIRFGTHVAFAYGPLGFLADWSLYYTTTTLLAYAFMIGFFTIMFGLWLKALRRRAPLVVAFVTVFVAGCVSVGVVAHQYTGGAEKILPVALLAGVYVLTRRRTERIPDLAWLGLGVGTGIFTLIKMSVGAAVLLVVLITLVCMAGPRLRPLALYAGSTVASGALGWFATGNGFGNLVPFARSTLAIVSGYGPAVETEDPTRWYTYWLAAAMMIVVLAFALSTARRQGRRQGAGIGTVTVLVLWLLFKEGFTRHDQFHDPVFFGALSLVVVAVSTLADWRPTTAAALAATLVAVLAFGSVPPPLKIPGSGAWHFLDEMSALLSPDQRAQIVSSDQAELRIYYSMPGPIVAAMAGHTVDVDPWEQTVAWADPAVRFDPLPGLQGYSTYTGYLDQLDVNDLASADAPTYILRQLPDAPDGGDPVFEPPATELAIECRYRQVVASGGWQLVKRVPDRCGPPVTLETISTGFGKWVAVPQPGPGQIMTATFKLSMGLAWAAESEVFKPTTLSLLADSGEANYRFIAGTAADTHVLVSASNLGWTRDFTSFPITSLELTVGGRGTTSSGVQVTFSVVPMSN